MGMGSVIMTDITAMGERQSVYGIWRGPLSETKSKPRQRAELETSHWTNNPFSLLLRVPVVVVSVLRAR